MGTASNEPKRGKWTSFLFPGSKVCWCLLHVYSLVSTKQVQVASWESTWTRRAQPIRLPMIRCEAAPRTRIITSLFLQDSDDLIAMRSWSLAMTGWHCGPQTEHGDA